MVNQAQELLYGVERSLNAKKTEVVSFNIPGNVNLMTLDGDLLAVTDDFKYPGSYISSSEKDIRVRKVQAWHALHKLKNIWHSSMAASMKMHIFVASGETILTYGCKAWTVTVRDEARLESV